MAASVRDIVNDALALVGEVSGAGVQQYSEDRMMKDAIRSFNLLFKKFHWHQYRSWFRFQLDGTFGVINTDGLENVLDFEDFISVHRDGNPVPLPILPEKVNPYTFSSRGSVRYWTGLNATDANYTKRKLQFFPTPSTDFVNILAMVYPHTIAEPWVWTDEMHLDKDMLVYGTAFMTLATDDFNANGTMMCKGLMEGKFKDILNSFAKHRIPIEAHNGIPTEWSEMR